MSCHFLLQSIFLTHGSKLLLLSLLHWQADSVALSYLGSPFSSEETLNTSVVQTFWFHLPYLACDDKILASNSLSAYILSVSHTFVVSACDFVSWLKSKIYFWSQGIFSFIFNLKFSLLFVYFILKFLCV